MEPDQRDWRFCTKCNALFFNDHQHNARGKCPRDQGPHDPHGFNFEPNFNPEFDLADTPTTQARWRFCVKCHVMFWQGSAPADRACAGGGPHEEAGFHFMLPVNRIGAPALVPETPTGQGQWRFCGKCTSMFFNGFADKGKCPRDGGTHSAIGDTFVLPHDQHPRIHLQDEGQRVRVSGGGFVPDGKVFITRQFRRDSTFTQGPAGEVRADNNDGSFQNFVLDLPGTNVINIAVGATDAHTSLMATGQLR